MGSITVCDQVCLGVVSISSLLPMRRVQSPPVDERGMGGWGKFVGRGLMTMEFLLKDLSLGR